MVRGQGQLRREALRLHQRLVVDHDELALVRPAVPLQEDPGALVAQQPQLRAAETVVGGHRGQRGVVGRGDGAVHGRRGAVIGQLQVHAVRGALGGNHALQHVEGRLVCLVGETRGQRALQRCDAASVRGHLSVSGGQGRSRC